MGDTYAALGTGFMAALLLWPADHYEVPASDEAGDYQEED